MNSPIYPENTTLSSPTILHDRIDETSSDSDDDTDQPLFQFKIANPDTLTGDNSTNMDRRSFVKNNNDMDSTLSNHQNRKVISKTATLQENQHIQQQLHGNDDGHSLASTQLSRRQSKTLEIDTTSPKIQHRNTFHAIQEAVESKSSSASVYEPLITATKEKLQIRSALPSQPPATNTTPSDSTMPATSSLKQSHNMSNSAHTIQSFNSCISNHGKTLTNDHTEHFDQQRDYRCDINTQSGMLPTTSSKSTITPTTPGSKVSGRIHLSKYNHASYSLMNNPDALKLYRQMAEKTQDETVQLSYAKYLFEVAALYQPQQQSGTTAVADITGEEKKRAALEQEGVRWIQRLSKKGVGEAAFLQARWMETQQYGFKMPKQAHKIDRHYLVAVQAGVPEAFYRLAVRQEAANHSPLQDTFRLYQKAADLQCVQAIYKMAKIYLHGDFGQQQHLVKGMNYLLSAVNHATTECHEPPYVLALILTNKYSKLAVPSELLQSFGGVAHVVEYMEQAANLGNMGAKNRSAHIYEHGLYGVHMNMAKAFQYYQEAADKGQHLQAMLGLSRLYNGGCHGPNDNEEHLRLSNDVSGWLASTPKDEDQSFYWCQRAAKGGLPDGLFMLGWYYEIGWGHLPNHQYSVECYQQAAGKGQLDAKARLENRHSFTRHQHEEIFGNRKNVIQLDGGVDGHSVSGSRTSDDCIVM